MAIQNAMKLIRDIKTDRGLRDKMNSLQVNELDLFLKKAGYKFTYDDFDNAQSMLHVKCQTYEEAEELMQIVTWLKLLLPNYN